MGKINLSRVVLGGIVAGIVIDVFEGILNGAILSSQWSEVLTGLGKTVTMSAKQIVAFNVWGLAVGILTVGLYAAIRPRFGPGPKTAIIAGLVLWLLAYVWPSLGNGLMGFMPMKLLTVAVLWGLAEVIVAALVGGALYKEM